MGRFNLVDEPWISVIVDDAGTTELVSLKTLFEETNRFLALAGDSDTQDFAVLRVLLAVLHTVFSRYDANGNPYAEVELDEKMRQLKDVDEDDLEDYTEALDDTWNDLWAMEAFPQIVTGYLEMWKDRFNLFDDTYGFFQVRESDISGDKINKKTASETYGRNYNRLIAESNNKPSLFSPKSEIYKNIQSDDEIARWLISFQGYTFLADKTSFVGEKYKSSKGWLYDIGGIYVTDQNLFKTLLANLALVHPESQYHEKRQRPCWEYEPSEIVTGALLKRNPDNLAELYTNWSRALRLKPDAKSEGVYSLEHVKLPAIEHTDAFLELMTIWRYNLDGENKEHFTPVKHAKDRALWRSFGLFTQTAVNVMSNGKLRQLRRPGIIDWVDEKEEDIGSRPITLHAVSMEDDGNATSWMPVGEICDELRIGDFLLVDTEENGWTQRVNDVVSETKEMIETIYRAFVVDLALIRNMDSNASKDFVNREKESVYSLIDKPFRDWIASITQNASKEEKTKEWKDILKQTLKTQARALIQQGGARDYTGIIVDDRVKNVAISYNIFLAKLSKK